MPINVSSNKNVLIAGPTASGKSALAMMIARAQGGVIVNADALQVYGGWRIVTARPSAQDELDLPHQLYGHVPFDAPYSVGDWLREVKTLLGQRLIIVGGTGLYFSALTNGLADIPPTPDDIRAEGDASTLQLLVSQLDSETSKRIDLSNRARVQRAWEVNKTTGTSLATWQDSTPPPVIHLDDCTPILLNAPKGWLTPRIERRFDLMLEIGALDEAREILPKWDPTHASSKAIGASDLIRHLNGEFSLDQARENVVVATRQYAKRQRTWFRKRMKDWHQVDLSSTDLSTAFEL